MFVTVGSCVYLIDSVLGQQGKYSLGKVDQKKPLTNSLPEVGRLSPEEYEKILTEIDKDLHTVPFGTRSLPQIRCPISPKKTQDINDTDFIAEKFFGFEDLNIGTFGDISKANYLSADKVDQFWVLRLCVKNEEQSEMSIRQIQNLKNSQSQFVTRFLGVYDSSSSDDLSKYVILENLSLGTLADYNFWHIERKEISEHAIKYTVASVVSGVSFIHSQDIIFLGVTPHHIGIDDKGKVKLFDFGWSHHKDESPWDHPGYVGWSRPPEALSDTPVYDANADSFAIGVLAFFLHFNRSPFEDENAQDYPDTDYDEHLQHMTDLCDVVISAQLLECSSLAQDFIILHTRCDPSMRHEVNAGPNGHIWLEGYSETDLSLMESPLLALIQNKNRVYDTTTEHPEELFLSARDTQNTNPGHDLDLEDSMHEADNTCDDVVNSAVSSVESMVLNSILNDHLEHCTTR